MIVGSSTKDAQIVHDYDILLQGGLLRMITIFPDLGDEVHENNDAIWFIFPERPSFSNPKQIQPAEETKLFKRHVLMVNRRIRTVEPLPTAVDVLDAGWQPVQTYGRPN